MTGTSYPNNADTLWSEISGCSLSYAGYAGFACVGLSCFWESKWAFDRSEYVLPYSQVTFVIGDSLNPLPHAADDVVKVTDF